MGGRWRLKQLTRCERFGRERWRKGSVSARLEMDVVNARYAERRKKMVE